MPLSAVIQILLLCIAAAVADEYPQLCWTRPQIRTLENGWSTTYRRLDNSPFNYNVTNSFKIPGYDYWNLQSIGTYRVNSWVRDLISDNVHPSKQYSNRVFWQANNTDGSTRGIVFQGHSEWITADEDGDSSLNSFGSYVAVVKQSPANPKKVIETYSTLQYIENFDGSTSQDVTSSTYEWDIVAC
mmetsp:Transcript_3080/g.3430  ORF Transcript_3080/g.3430 Transcript_3080/m.3430 type:complete len:186 (-) Transcript_3080:31-588(-)